MKVAFITFSEEGVRLGALLGERMTGIDYFVHEGVEATSFTHERFASVRELAGRLFREYEGLVFCGPTGIAVRAIAPLLAHKSKDPAVVVVDICGRFALSLLGGHEAGANRLAVEVANALGAEPVITTTTEARKRCIVGVGCRRGTSKEAIINAVRSALETASIQLEEVRLLASGDLKRDEAGLIEAARELDLPLRFIASSEIKAATGRFVASAFVEKKVGLPAVAEPSAVLAGRRAILILPRTKFPGVTVAIARENCSSSE
jgi:cobalt-precorrin 5A hydrolase